MSRTNFIRALYFCIAVLLIANLFFIYAEMIAHNRYSVAWRFYFDRRLNFPFFFSLLLQLINLLLLYKNMIRKDAAKKLWTSFFVAFLLFTLDETFYIHQHFKMSTFGVIASYDRASWSHYLWVVPYFVLFGSLMILIFIYSKALSSDLKKRILVAGIIFLFGAVVMEFAGTFYGVIHPHADINILLIKSAEGVLQMIGSVMFIDAFWRGLEQKHFA